MPAGQVKAAGSGSTQAEPLEVGAPTQRPHPLQTSPVVAALPSLQVVFPSRVEHERDVGCVPTLAHVAPVQEI
jgi:hypothetical protein